ncbi:MAG: Smr/MutS family protein [Bacteroidales bacterium]|nr:Smr/MutS family protein [Bacteroidales bacterium]
MKELFFEEQREIHRILLEFSDSLRENLDCLLACYEMLIRIDFIRGKAEYALETNASMPQMTQQPIIKWYDARHPILENALKQKGKQITPLKIELNEKQRILVISGPNAGGKSVCLKTVALLQYMLQCGLLVPMKEISTAGIFEKIFLSIGDEQSLSDDLSTYSSHLKNLSEICENSDRDTLFLIDELGTGTDPAAGGAIAESILEHLNAVKSYGVVTTHYSVLKHLAFDHEGLANAAMLFDTKAMKPLYTLTIGNPGSSFAFEIAAKTGLSESIIANAKKKLGKQSIRFEEKLQQIEVNKLESEKHLRSAKQYDEILYQTVQKYREMSLKLELERKNILNSARNEAKDILSSANRQIERTIEQIKTAKAEKETVKKLKEEVKNNLITLDKAIKEEDKKAETNLKQITNGTVEENSLTEPLKKKNIKIVSSPIELNDYVIFPQTENIGQVVAIDKNRLQIDMGDMRIQTTEKNVRKIDKHSYLKQLRDNSRNTKVNDGQIQIKTSFDLNKIRIHFNEKLDLRGYRGEEALSELEKFLDNARMLGERNLKILHGKGDGILKTLVRDYLRRQSDILSFHAEDIRFGGEGITVVQMQ